MSPAAKHVGRVCRLFPDWVEEIPRLAMRSERFRTLCEDYGMAFDALALLRMRSLPEDVEKTYEYQALIADLEKDLKYELLAARPSDEPG